MATKKTTTGKRPLSEIIDLLRSCQALGVRKFKGLGVEFEMGEAPPPQITQAESVKPDPTALLQHEQLIREEQLERLRLEDPLEYEELMTQKELVSNDRQAHTGTEG